MPCTPQACTNAESNIGPNFALGDHGWTGNAFQHYANMGWVGFVKAKFGRDIKWGSETLYTRGQDVMLRVLTADLKLSQEIKAAEVIDGRIDRTAYWLGPKIVEGTLGFPLVADNGVGGCPPDGPVGQAQAAALLNAIWQWGLTRDSFGRLCYADTDLIVRYANHAAFKYTRCLINELSLKVAKEDMITMDLGVIAQARFGYGDDPDLSGVNYNEICPLNSDDGWTGNPDLEIPAFLAPARILTWNDFSVNGMHMEGTNCANQTPLFWSNQIREFNLTINNHAERYYSLNGTLAPVDINVGKREITGSMTLLGYNHALRRHAETNQDRFTSKDELRMAIYIGDDASGDVTTSSTGLPRDWYTGTYTQIGNAIQDQQGNSHYPIFARKLVGVVFQIEEVALTNDVLETTVNYLSLGTDTSNYEAFSPPTSCGYPIWDE